MMKTPTEYTDNEIAFAIIDCGGYMTAIAKTLGVNVKSLRGYIANRPQLRELLEDQREELLDNAERGLVKAVNAGNLTAIRFVLSRLGRSRGYGQKLEVSSTGEGRVIVYLPDDGRETKPNVDGDSTTAGTASNGS